ncbi:MAG: CehA/McbA family metallohydrolase, partial [Pseudoflavonifractor sp.]
YDVIARVKTASGWSAEVRADQTEDWVCAPRIVATPTGATVCWYTFGYGATFAVYSADLAVSEGALCAAPALTLTENVGWYMDLTAASNKAGLQIVAYTWSKNSVQIRYRRGAGAWSLPAQMSYGDGHCAMYPSLLVGEDESICLAWQFAHHNGHFGRNAQIVLTHFTPEDIDRRADKGTESAENTFCIPISAEKYLDARTPAEVAAWLAKNGYEGTKLLFGDIHGQSGISDGMGKIDQYYYRSRAKAKLDFSALTDHDCYPDWISQSEWQLMRTTNRLMDTDGELSCLLAFEWTPNEYQYDFGHKNIYYRDDNGDIFRSGDQSGITPTDLYASIKQYRGMCIPHHPAADWGSVSAATDWSFHDTEIERLAEIYSRHAPYEDFESRSKYTKNIKKMPRHSVQDALARGHRMGFTAGSDSHQMEHGVEGGIVAVFTPAHTRADIWDSLFDRRCYGTTGARILLSVKAEGANMGSELKLAPGLPVRFAISVLGTQTVKVEVLKNNKVIQTWAPDSDACDVTFEDSHRSESDYYYVRVTQPDEHMAWSSPIWVDAQ